MISIRAKGVKRIILEYNRLYIGKTNKSEGRRILNNMYESTRFLQDIEDLLQRAKSIVHPV